MRILKMVQLGPLALLCSLFLVACSEGYDHSEEATEKTFGAGVLEAHAGGANPMETLLIHSDVLQENRKIYVQLPEGYERSAEAYPVLYVMDGEWLFDLANAHARYYSYDEVTDITLPRMIVVGIENIDRDRDYTPTPNGGIEYDFPTAGFADNFITFLETELFSLISDRYRTAPLRAIAGWSNSGLFANYVATKNQDLFDMYLCISPAVWWDQDMIYDRFDGFAFDRAKRFVYSLGTNEEGGIVFASTTRLLKRFERNPVPNMSLSHFKIEGVGHSWGVSPAFNRGLQELFADYLAPDDVISAGIDATQEYYQDLSGRWRYKVDIPIKVLLSIAFDLWDDAPHEAIQVLQTASPNSADYPTSLYYLGLLYKNTGDRELAKKFIRKAIEEELRKVTPNEVNRRSFAMSLMKLEETSES